jgi:transposase
MFDVSDDAKGEFRRVEVLTGPGRRRRWSADEKAQIVAETLVPGARVAEVARRWQICSQQVFGWRRAMRQDVLSVPREPRNAGDAQFCSDCERSHSGCNG